MASIDKSYYLTLAHRINLLQTSLPRKSIVHSTLITTYGLDKNEYSGDFQQVITLDNLF